MVTQEPTLSFKDRLKMFQDRAVNGRKRPQLARENTVPVFQSRYKTDNVIRVLNQIDKRKKDEEEKQEQITKEIHENKKVDYSFIRQKTQQNI